MAAGFLALEIVGFEVEGNQNEGRIPFRILRDAQNPMEMGHMEFVNLFRISKEIGHFLINSLSSTLQPKRRHGLSVQSQVGSTFN